MKTWIQAVGAASVTLLLLPSSAAAQDTPDDKIAKRDLREFKAMLPGTYTNEEQVYFQGNLDMAEERRLPRLTLTIEKDGDGFLARTLNPATGDTTEARLSYRVEGGKIRSREVREGQADCERTFTRSFESFRGEGCGGVVVASPDGFQFGMPGNPFTMHRAIDFKCWVSPRKESGKYGFYPNQMTHNQGGWVRIPETGEGEEKHPAVSLKMRHVEWPTGRNKDSLVLYVYRDGDESRSVSYAWADPDAKMLAINLRWVQASCSRQD